MKPQHCFHSCVIEHLRKHRKRLTFKKPLRDRQAWGKVLLRRDLRELIFPYLDVKRKNIYSSFVVEKGMWLAREEKQWAVSETSLFGDLCMS